MSTFVVIVNIAFVITCIHRNCAACLTITGEISGREEASIDKPCLMSAINVHKTSYQVYKYESEFQTTDGASEQFVLQRFDTAPFCCVINKCRTRTSDKLETCVHSVVFLCSICRNLYRTKSIRGRH